MYLHFDIRFDAGSFLPCTKAAPPPLGVLKNAMTGDGKEDVLDGLVVVEVDT
jgi:hypothetical protein